MALEATANSMWNCTWKSFYSPGKRSRISTKQVATLPMQIKSDTHATSNALFGAAVLFLGPGLISWPIFGLRFDFADCLLIAGSSFLLGMGIWARFTPLAPATISAAAFVTFMGWQLVHGRLGGLVLWILFGTIFLLLIVALASALRKRPSGTVE